MVEKEQRSNDAVFPFAFFEGKVVPIAEANVNIRTNGLHYGTGIFGGLRGYETDGGGMAIFRLPDHAKRFYGSLAILDQTLPYDEKQFQDIILDLSRKNEPKSDFYIRPLAFAADYHLGPDLSKSRFDLAVYMMPLKEYFSAQDGLRLCFSSWVRLMDNSIPSRVKATGAYMNSALARADAVRLGYHDALMLNAAGHVAEGSAANFFMVRAGKLITSSPSEDILEGITRRSVMELAQDLGIEVVERVIDKTEVFIADEAFLTGTAAQVSWIANVDGRIIGSGKLGPITEIVQKAFFDVVRGKNEQYKHWLTKV